MQSLKSRALEPTRTELARMSWSQAILRLVTRLWAAAARGRADHPFFHSAADHVSHPVQRSVDPERQIDRSPSRAVGAAPDDRGPHRPYNRLRHRALAYSRDQPPDQSRVPVGAERARRSGVRRADGAHQRDPGRGGSDRLLHRNAWNGVPFSMRSLFGTRAENR